MSWKKKKISPLQYEVIQLSFLILSPFLVTFLTSAFLYVAITKSMHNQFSIILFSIPDITLQFSSKLIWVKKW